MKQPTRVIEVSVPIIEPRKVSGHVYVVLVLTIFLLDVETCLSFMFHFMSIL
jgi:hypothetical protein